MAWTTPRTWAAGDFTTAAMLNTYIRDNFAVSEAAIVTTAGDIVYALGANSLQRLAAGNYAQYLFSGTVPSWGDFVGFTSTSITSGGPKIVTAAAVAGVAVTLIGSITKGCRIVGITVPSAGTPVANSISVIVGGGNVECFTGGANSLLASITTGNLQVIRNAGALTYTVAFSVVYN